MNEQHVSSERQPVQGLGWYCWLCLMLRLFLVWTWMGTVTSDSAQHTKITHFSLHLLQIYDCCQTCTFIPKSHNSDASHNERDGASNHRHLNSLLYRLFRHRSKTRSNSRLLASVGEFISCQQRGKCFHLITSSPKQKFYAQRYRSKQNSSHSSANFSAVILKKAPYHDDVIAWSHFSRYWPFVRGMHWWSVDSVPGDFTAQRPATRSFDVFFDLRLNKWLSKQSWGWWSETLSRPSWRHCNGIDNVRIFEYI